jgi:cell division protease FtsH
MPKFARFSENDLDDDTGSATETTINSAAALAQLVLDKALGASDRKILKRGPGVFILHAPDPAWVPILADHIKTMKRSPIVKEVVELEKKKNLLNRAGQDALPYIQDGHSIAFVTHDPDALLDETILASADLVLKIPHLDLALLRRLIRKVTGASARGLTRELTELPLPVVLAAIRPGRTPRQCITSLERALLRGSLENRVSPSVPRIESLPLTKPIRDWTDDTLADLAAVKSGQLAPERLTYGVLEGPPGTGKTLIAKSLGASAGWSFVDSSVGSWFATGDGYLGGVVQNLKAFIDRTLASAPAIGFLDELDALPDRAGLDSRSREWWTPVVTMFLTEIDRVRRAGRPVLLLGASNYYARLDAALVRSGRLQQQISVLPPDTEAEALDLLNYFAGKRFERPALARIARLAIGATPAKVEAVYNDAVRLARHNGRDLSLTDLIDALTPRDTRRPDDVRAIAIHEIGHAIVAERLGHEVKSVSIVPDGITGGVTEMGSPSIVFTNDLVRELVLIALAGRAADIVAGTGPNAGAEADLANATNLLVAAYRHQGLGPSLVSHQSFAHLAPPPALLAEIDAELSGLLQKAIDIVTADRTALVELTERLVNERILTGEDIASALSTRGVGLAASDAMSARDDIASDNDPENSGTGANEGGPNGQV